AWSIRCWTRWVGGTRRKGSRCSSSSRTCRRRWIWPTGATCCRRAAWCWRAEARSSAAATWCGKPIWECELQILEAFVQVADPVGLDDLALAPLVALAVRLVQPVAIALVRATDALVDVLHR